MSRGNPAHVAIIMDGNRRWAKHRFMPAALGHAAGAARVKEIARACPDLGVKYLTIFAFSTENWKRTQPESGLDAPVSLLTAKPALIKAGAGAVHRGIVSALSHLCRDDGT